MKKNNYKKQAILTARSARSSFFVFGALILGNLFATEQYQGKYLLDALNKSENQENTASPFELGCMYYNGTGVKQDYQIAFKYFLEAAKEEHAHAQCMVADMYYDGKYVEQDYKQAFEWYSKAAEKGMVEAQNSLGCMYYYGKHVKQDYKQALEWYTAFT